MTKVQAIKKILEDNQGIASWNTIYNEILEVYKNPIANIKNDFLQINNYL